MPKEVNSEAVLSLCEDIREVLKEEYDAEKWIQRFIGSPLNIKESFVHVAIVDEKQQAQKEERLREKEQARDNILGSWEDIHKPKTEMPLDDFFKLKGKVYSKRHIVLGRAGIGKSILCQRIAYLWNQDKLWQGEHFDYVFWIPLRRINSREFPPSHYETSLSVADIIQRLCLNNKVTLTPKDWELIKKNKKILYLLDGYDETSHLENIPYLKNPLDEILAEATYMVLTSRPYKTNITHTDRTLEILGFNDEDMDTYIDKALLDSGKHQQLKSFLKENPNIKGLSHIPINLDLICSIWKAENIKNRNQPFQAPFTMTSLYRKIVDYLFDRYFQSDKAKQKGFNRDAEITFKSNIIRILGIVANNAMQSGEPLLIPAEDIEAIIQSHFPDKNLCLQDIHDAGLLKPTGEGSLDMRASYFLHLTFQEYFMAHYLSEAETSKMASFILEYRYNFRFQVVFKFLAGLLFLEDKSSEKERVLYFFEKLYQQPQDLLGLHHLLLAVECLDECEDVEPLYEVINRRYHLLDDLKKWISRAIPELTKYKQNKYKYVDYIIRFLSTSVHLFENDEILSLFKNWKDKSQAILRLGQIKRTNKTISSFLQKCFDDGYFKRKTVKALYEIGPANDATSLFKSGLTDEDSFVRFYCAFALFKLGLKSEKELIDHLLIPFESPNLVFKDLVDLEDKPHELLDFLDFNYDMHLIDLVDKLQKSTDNEERILNAFILYLVSIHSSTDYLLPKCKEAILTISKRAPQRLIHKLQGEIIKIKENTDATELIGENIKVISIIIDILGQLKETKENLDANFLFLDADRKLIQFSLEELCTHPDEGVCIVAIRALFTMNVIKNNLIEAFIAKLSIMPFSYSKEEEIAKIIEILGSHLSEKIFDSILVRIKHSINTNEYPYKLMSGLAKVMKVNEVVFNKLKKLLNHGNSIEQHLAISILIQEDPVKNTDLLMDKLNPSVDLKVQLTAILGLIFAEKREDFLFRKLIAACKKTGGSLAQKIAIWVLEIIGVNFNPTTPLRSLLSILKETTGDRSSVFLSGKTTTLDFLIVVELIKVMTLGNYQSDDVRNFLAKFDLSPWLSEIQFHFIGGAITRLEDILESEEASYVRSLKYSSFGQKILRRSPKDFPESVGFLPKDWKCALKGSPAKTLIQLYFELPEEKEKLQLLLQFIYEKTLNDKFIITTEDKTLTVFDGASFLKITLDSELQVHRLEDLKNALDKSSQYYTKINLPAEDFKTTTTRNLAIAQLHIKAIFLIAEYYKLADASPVFQEISSSELLSSTMKDYARFLLNKLENFDLPYLINLRQTKEDLHIQFFSHNNISVDDTLKAWLIDKEKIELSSWVLATWLLFNIYINKNERVEAEALIFPWMLEHTLMENQPFLCNSSWYLLGYAALLLENKSLAASCFACVENLPEETQRILISLEPYRNKDLAKLELLDRRKLVRTTTLGINAEEGVMRTVLTIGTTLAVASAPSPSPR